MFGLKVASTFNVACDDAPPSKYASASRRWHPGSVRAIARRLTAQRERDHVFYDGGIRTH
jgi:hypothetical protein